MTMISSGYISCPICSTIVLLPSFPSIADEKGIVDIIGYSRIVEAFMWLCLSKVLHVRLKMGKLIIALPIHSPDLRFHLPDESSRSATSLFLCPNLFAYSPEFLFLPEGLQQNDLSPSFAGRRGRLNSSDNQDKWLGDRTIDQLHVNSTSSLTLWQFLFVPLLIRESATLPLRTTILNGFCH